MQKIITSDPEKLVLLSGNVINIWSSEAVFLVVCDPSMNEL
jgi:hypothetical protein